MVEDYESHEMIHRDVYVGDKHVGVVVGEDSTPEMSLSSHSELRSRDRLPVNS